MLFWFPTDFSYDIAPYDTANEEWNTLSKMRPLILKSFFIKFVMKRIVIVRIWKQMYISLE